MNLNYNNVLNMVSEVLDKYDLAYIIVDECQVDEYKSEAEDITTYIFEQDEDSIFGLGCYIQNLFIKYFETIFSFEDCIEIAVEIIDKIEEMKEVK